MKNYKVMDGNEACSYISYLFSELASIYPITPASAMAEKVDELSSKKFNNLYGNPVKVVEMLCTVLYKQDVLQQLTQHHKAFYL